MKTLVLNSTMQPLDVVSWKDGIRLIYQGKVDVILWYEGDGVRTPSGMHRVPSIIRLREKANFRRDVAKFSRRAVFVRDEYTCSYCGSVYHTSGLSLDHIEPRSRGGDTSWTNITSACRSCNQRKADLTLREVGMSLKRPAFEPRYSDVVKRDPATPEEWHDFLW